MLGETFWSRSVYVFNNDESWSLLIWSPVIYIYYIYILCIYFRQKYGRIIEKPDGQTAQEEKARKTTDKEKEKKTCQGYTATHTPRPKFVFRIKSRFSPDIQLLWLGRQLSVLSVEATNPKT